MLLRHSNKALIVFVTTEVGETHPEKGLQNMLDLNDNVLLNLKTIYSATIFGEKHHVGNVKNILGLVEKKVNSLDHVHNTRSHSSTSPTTRTHSVQLHHLRKHTHFLNHLLTLIHSLDHLHEHTRPQPPTTTTTPHTYSNTHPHPHVPKHSLTPTRTQSLVHDVDTFPITLTPPTTADRVQKKKNLSIRYRDIDSRFK